MLSLDLTRIRTPEEHIEQVYGPAAFPVEEGDLYRVAEPAALSFDIFKDKAQFRLAGRVGATLELSCSRCLEPFLLPIDAEFDLRYQPHTENTGEGEREVEEDDLTTAFYENDTIDLGLLMREQFYLVLPMKPLCSDGCLGLCAMCGTNLNRESCDCKRDWEDPRLAVLRTLASENRKPEH